MNEQTIIIILLSKKAYKKYPEAHPIKRIIHYLSDANIIEKEYFRDFQYELTRFIKNIMYDYIDNCDKPSDFLKSIENIKLFTYDKISELDCILQAFKFIQIVSDGKYINGFNETMEEIKKCLEQ